MNVLFWELVQNTPIVLALGLALRYQINSGSLYKSLIIGVFGAIISSLCISITEKYKLRQPDRKFDLKEFMVNGIVFAIPVCLYLLYANIGNYIRDIFVGLVIGSIVGIGQWVFLKLQFNDGLRHAVAMIAMTPIVFTLLRYGYDKILPISLLIYISTALVMTIIIYFIDYFKMKEIK